MICEADSWFFVFSTEDGHKIYNRVAVWSKSDDGEVVGLIAVTGQKGDNGEFCNRLVTPPPLDGTYVHFDDISDEDKKLYLEVDV